MPICLFFDLYVIYQIVIWSKFKILDLYFSQFARWATILARTKFSH